VRYQKIIESNFYPVRTWCDTLHGNASAAFAQKRSEVIFGSLNAPVRECVRIEANKDAAAAKRKKV